ncbi:MAG: hypothetical protein V4459_08510 [Pseudomonadota bacterium]
MADENAIEMRAMMARWESLRARWRLEAHEEAGLLGGAALTGPLGDVASWHAARMEQRMRLLIDLATALDALLVDGARIRNWLRRPLESTGGRAPIDAMASSVEWIRQFRGVATDFAS